MGCFFVVANRHGAPLAPDLVTRIAAASLCEVPSFHQADGLVCGGTAYAQVGSLTIVGDLRVDDLENLADRFASTNRTPAEILLAGYQRHGADLGRLLVGDYAFAVWDARERRLTGFRDAFGVNPMYVVEREPGTIAMGSEIAPLLAATGASADLDELRIAEFLCGITADPVRTFYKHASSVAPGTTLIAHPEQLERRRHFEWNTIELPGDLDAAFVDAVTSAVERRFTPGTTGVLLSGGLDSSAVACAAARLSAVPTYSMVSDDRDVDERRYIDDILQHQPRLTNHRRRLEEIAPLAEPSLFHPDAPASMPHLATMPPLYRTAAEHGNTCLLSGIDGDSVVSRGYGHFKELAYAGRWHRLGQQLVRAHRPDRPAWQILRDHVAKPMLGHLFPAGWYMRESRSDGFVPPFLNRDFADRHSIRERMRAILRATAHRDHRPAHQEALEGAFHAHAIGEIRRSAALEGIDHRPVFYDTDLVRLCFSLPAEMKFYNGAERAILRRSFSNLRGELTSWRTDKTLFDRSVFSALMQNSRNDFERALAQRQLLKEFVDLESLSMAYSQFAMTREASLGYHLWGAASLAHWLDTARTR